MSYCLNECKIAVRVHNRQDGGFNVHIEIFDVATGENIYTFRKEYTNLSLPMLQHFTRQKAYDLARDCGYDHVRFYDFKFRNPEEELLYG